MTRIKRAFCLFAVFVMTAGFLAGCALFERDVNYYNNLVVATVGANIEITKRQLIQAYNSFGYQYVTQQELSTKEAYNKTLEELIDREIMVELAIQNFSFNHMSDAAKAAHIKNLRGKSGAQSLYYDALYEYEKVEARKQAFDALNNYYTELQDKVREERKLVFKAAEDAEDPNTKTPTVAQEPFKAFEPLVKRNATNTAFDMDISAFISREVYKDVPEQWLPDIDDGGDNIVQLVKTEALARLVRVLSNNERGMKVGTKEAGLVAESKYLKTKERALIGRELGRMLEDYSKSLLLRRFQDAFDLGIDAPIDRSQFERAEGYELAIRAAILGIKNIPVRSQYNSASMHEAALRELIRDASGGQHAADCVDLDSCLGCWTATTTQRGRANSIATQAQDYYTSQVIQQYNRFMKKMETEASLASKVVEDLNGVFWLPKNVAESNFTVSHILIQYSESQKAEFDEIKAEFASGGFVNIQNYDSRMQALAGKLSAPARDEKGVETGESKTALKILEEIKSAIGGKTELVPQIDGTMKDGINVPAFTNDMDEVARRNEETRRINIFRDFIYKYNQDPGMNNAEFEYVMSIENSKMVQEFTDASRELFGYMKVAKMKGDKPVFDQTGNPVYEWKGINSIAGLHLANCDGFKGGVKCGGCKNGYVAARSSMTYDLVMTEFGAHIVMYTRPLSDFIYNTRTDFLTMKAFETALQNDVNSFLYAPLTSYGNDFGMAKNVFPNLKQPISAPAKTVFDVAVEKANKPAFENRRNSYLVDFKNERKNGQENGKLINKITINRGNFKDLIR